MKTETGTRAARSVRHDVVLVALGAVLASLPAVAVAQCLGEVAGSPCIDLDSNSCTVPGCDGNDECDQAYALAPVGVLCTDDDGNACTAAQCDAAGVCDQEGGFQALGTPCPDTDGDGSTLAACDGFGTCDQDYVPPPRDHYKCYKTHAPFSPRNVDLVDQFASTSAIAKSFRRVCNPVDKNDEGIDDPTAHLGCYRIKEAKGERQEVFVENQFGVQKLEVRRAESLCMPAQKDGIGSELNINHFKCYKAREARREPRFTEQVVNLEDQFEVKSTRVKRPRLFCNPVDKNGEGIVDPENHLVCYNIKDSAGQPQFQKRRVDLLDQFTAEEIPAVRGDCSKVSFLCVPSVQDDGAPFVFVTQPLNLRGATFDDHFIIAGTARDDVSGIESVVLKEGDTEIPLDLTGDPEDEVEFSHELTLPAPEGMEIYTYREVEIVVTDRAGNTATVTVRIDRAAEYVPGHLLCTAKPGTPPPDAVVPILAAGGTVRRYIREANVYVVDFATNDDALAAISDLLASGLFASVERDHVMLPDATPRDGWFLGPGGTLDQEALQIINAPGAWDITTGSSTVTVGIIDSGADLRHPELENQFFLNSGELPVSESIPLEKRFIDTNGDGVITLGDLNHPTNVEKYVHLGDKFSAFNLTSQDLAVSVGSGLFGVGNGGDLDGDGCPGLCGIDDDLDGLADLQDPEVQSADYDRDGSLLWGADATFGTSDDDPEDVMLASWDDDENGVADDVVGFDYSCSPEATMEQDGRVTCTTFKTTNRPHDLRGHGTGVAGIIGAREDDQQVSVVGVNWNVRLAITRNAVGDTGFVSESQVLASASYLARLAQRPENRLKVVSMSEGWTRHGPPEKNNPIADVLDDAGVLLACSAGNGYLDLDEHLDANGDPLSSRVPASAENPNVISVAAANPDGSLARFSNRGSVQVDLAAPGQNLVTDPVVLTTGHVSEYFSIPYRDADGNFVDDLVPSYRLFDGTSAATPYVSGVIGLMQAANPALTHIALKNLLLSSVDSSYDLNVATKGLLDARAVVAAASTAPPPPFLEGTAADVDPAVSADGRVVAFVSNRVSGSNPFAKPRVWLVAADGTGLAEVPAPASASEVEPSLNGDGTLLAFASDRADGNFEIYVAEIDPADFSVASLTRRTNNATEDRYPVISEDGRFIAFASPFDASGDTLGDFEVFRVTTNDDSGAGLVIDQASGQITNDGTGSFSDPLLVDDRRPTISADGDVVAWVRSYHFAPTGGGNDAIGVATFGGGLTPSVQFINPVDTDKTSVTLAGSGPRIYFGRTNFDGPAAPGTEFWSVALDGSDLHSVPDGAGAGGVSPGGTFFASYSVADGGGDGLTRRNFDTGDSIQLATDVDLLNVGPADEIFFSCQVSDALELSSQIDHSSPTCSVALSRDGKTVVFVGTSREAAENTPQPPASNLIVPKDIYVFREGVGTLLVAR